VTSAVEIATLSKPKIRFRVKKSLLDLMNRFVLSRMKFGSGEEQTCPRVVFQLIIFFDEDF
jgi:hypothetical protein